MQLLYFFAVLFFFVNRIQTFPIGYDYKLQTIYTLNKEITEDTKKLNIEAQYDVYQTIMDYYENTVDNSISSSSEHLLLNLIHLPREELNFALATQMELIGLNDIPENEMYRLPSIIGKNIHEMNAHIYSLIQSLVLKNWHSIGLSDMVSSEKSDTISFMTSFNSAMAKSLLNEIRGYNLEEKIKQDASSLVPVPLSSMISLASSHPGYLSQILHNIKSSISHFSSKTASPTGSLLDGDFLTKYISDMGIDLLIELHIQFYDFYSQVKADLQPPFYES
ncbi:hypothetical protein K501DRAFT_329172 [Backusella circina FSU 941]|nr:hypothetical protein K501DRAFT_329172 [Backusella circina FSU 941]